MRIKIKKVNFKDLALFFFKTWAVSIIVFLAYIIIVRPGKDGFYNSLQSAGILSIIFIGVLSFVLIFISLFLSLPLMKVLKSHTLKNKTFLISVIIIGLIGAYALGKNQIQFQSSDINQERNIYPTLSISATIPLDTPIPTPEAKKVYYTEPTLDSDPPVHCSISPQCGGGTKPLKRSECDNSTCCQIKDQWIFYTDKVQCVRDQDSISAQNKANNSRVPVYIASYSVTFYCVPEGVDAVKSADQDYKNANSKYTDCLAGSSGKYSQCLSTNCKDLSTFASCSSTCEYTLGVKSCDIYKTSYNPLQPVLDKFCK